MKLRYVLFLVVTTISLLLNLPTQPASAQTTKEPAGFRSVTLWVYPEYDDPRLLVMLEGKITGVDAPALIRFLVPAAAKMYSAGWKDAQGKYTGGPPERKVSSVPGWDEISYELKTDTFRVEYYANEIVGMPDKTISYDFRFLYPISDLRVIVQQPLKATNFVVAPKGTATNEDQFKVQTYNFSNLNPDKDQPLHFDVSYTKLDLNPSIQNESGKSPPSGNGLSGGLIIMIAAGAIVIAAIFFWLGGKRKSGYQTGARAQRMPTRAERREHERHSQKKSQVRISAKEQVKPPKPESKTDEVCYYCGYPVESSDKFCPNCRKNLD